MPRILSQNYPLYDKPPHRKLPTWAQFLDPHIFVQLPPIAWIMLTNLEKDSLKCLVFNRFIAFPATGLRYVICRALPERSTTASVMNRQQSLLFILGKDVRVAMPWFEVHL
jgi:hypothetical protein